jgi:hypothetical protein
MGTLHTLFLRLDTQASWGGLYRELHALYRYNLQNYKEIPEEQVHVLIQP